MLCTLVLSACGAEIADPESTASRRSELSNGSQVLCQTCQPHESEVKLVTTGGAFCSGSVISSNRILTSAKCLRANSVRPAGLCITNRIQNTGCGGDPSETYNISRGFIHPYYTGTSSGYDAQVVEVDHTLRPFGNPTGTISTLPIDTDFLPNGFQADDFGFGTDPQNPSLTGEKQIRSDLPTVPTSLPNYAAIQGALDLTGDFGGGLIHGFNSLAGINSFVQNNTAFMTRTQPIHSWIAAPDVVGSVPVCSLTGSFFTSVHAGTCLQASSNTSAVSLEYCICTSLQRWNRLSGLQGAVFQSVPRNNMCLTATSPPSLTLCNIQDPNQNWFVIGGNTSAQLTSFGGAGGNTLLTNTMSTVSIGGSNAANRLWNLAPKAAPIPTRQQISADPFTTSDSQHATQVEPDSFAFGTTIVAVTQTGRFADSHGGSTGISFATSSDSGLHWTTDVLPALTTANGGTLVDRVTDPAVAFDARHNVWMAVSLGINTATDAVASQIFVSRSTNGGTTWTSPVIVSSAPSPFGYDKPWIACDNSSASPFFGNCYVEWDDADAGPSIEMSTSSNGGVTWGPVRTTANNAGGVGGQPLVQSNGTVIVVIPDSFISSLLAFGSTDGGGSWSAPTGITSISAHTPAGGLRGLPLPSAEIDQGGRVYVAWSDCRFRAGCPSNDIVMTTSTDGVNWTGVTQIPIDATNSTVDHFLPGLGVDRATNGSNAHLGLAYYFYPTANCTVSTCQLFVGFISSRNGGTTWSAPTTLAGPMSLAGLPDSDLGKAVGDYVSTSFLGGMAHPVYIVSAPIDLGGGVLQLNQSLFSATLAP